MQLHSITHATQYTYSSPVRVGHSVVVLTPRTDDRRSCLNNELSITPTPTMLRQRTDRFGNTVHDFSIEYDHSQLTILATSQVAVAVDVVSQTTPSSPAWDQLAANVRTAIDLDWFDVCPFMFASPRIEPSSDFRWYAAECFPPGRSLLESVAALVSQIHRDFTYDPASTRVDTSPAEALRLRRGVCQDLAHIGIASLRSLGIPARYVSGYIRTQPHGTVARLVGADHSHAWISVYAGEGVWFDFDPTNNMACGPDHIPLAWGRDYRDVAPVRGVFLGGGSHAMHVSVDVCTTENP